MRSRSACVAVAATSSPNKDDRSQLSRTEESERLPCAREWLRPVGAARLREANGSPREKRRRCARLLAARSPYGSFCDRPDIDQPETHQPRVRNVRAPESEKTPPSPSNRSCAARAKK